MVNFTSKDEDWTVQHKSVKELEEEIGNYFLTSKKYASEISSDDKEEF
ncbi:hypothetical protein [Fredinandcohnia sp. 179-A 10B2 NHS]